jgi:hypothetical protein
MSDCRLHESNGQGTTPEERIPINNVNSSGEDHVTVRPHSSRGKGCFVTRGQVCLAVLLVLVLLATTGIVVAIMMKDFFPLGQTCRDEGDASSTGAVTSQNNSRLTTPKPTVEPSLPWSDIRLPRAAIPVHYNLELRVDLETFTFTGSSDVTLDMLQATRYVIVHVNGLDVRRHEVTVRHVSSNHSVRISHQIHVPENQFYVVETESMLIAGEQYIVRFGHFKGDINDDLRGLYRSMYKDQNGNTK